MRRTFAKKSLGQNFLQSIEVRAHILEAAGDISGKNVLEIGPGLGFLTTKLVSEKANVTAVELDERSAETLRRDFGQKKNLSLIVNDILKTDLENLAFPGDDPHGHYSIVANIPYNITSHLIKKILAETKRKPVFAILMIQKEVAEKIAKDPKQKSPHRSLLSLSVEIFAESEILFEVGRENFFPVPGVDSAVIKLTTRTTPLVPETMQKDFFTVLHVGFSQKRKKIGNVLGPSLGIESALLLGDIDPNRRAETLSVEEWLAITRNFQNTVKK